MDAVSNVQKRIWQHISVCIHVDEISVCTYMSNVSSCTWVYVCLCLCECVCVCLCLPVLHFKYSHCVGLYTVRVSMSA